MSDLQKDQRAAGLRFTKTKKQVFRTMYLPTIYLLALSCACYIRQDQRAAGCVSPELKPCFHVIVATTDYDKTCEDKTARALMYLPTIDLLALTSLNLRMLLSVKSVVSAHESPPPGSPTYKHCACMCMHGPYK